MSGCPFLQIRCNVSKTCANNAADIWVRVGVKVLLDRWVREVKVWPLAVISTIDTLTMAVSTGRSCVLVVQRGEKWFVGGAERGEDVF